MSQEPGGGGNLKLINDEVKSKTVKTVVMYDSRAGWKWEFKANKMRK